MTDSRNGISSKQEKAVLALVQEPTIRDAAKAVRVNEVTLYRWLRAPDFQASYRQARRDIMSQAIARLKSCCSTAVQTLQDVMEDEEATAASRVASARAVLELACKAVELEDLEMRIAALEERLD